MTIPRSEYPRPQFVRSEWRCLNGEWQFEIDSGDSGLERGLNGRELSGKITVPFCPESSLSGVGNTDFLRAVWYRRVVEIPESWAQQRILLHFQAVDYDTTVWADAVEVGRQRGGFTPFTCDLTDVAIPGQCVTIVVRARDEHKAPQPMGKQSTRFAPYSCLYTRTTGIWQTVWLEPTPNVALKRPRITPLAGQGVIRVEQPVTANRCGYYLYATLSNPQGIVADARTRADLDLCPVLDLAVPFGRRRLWSIDDPFLYDLRIELRDESDQVIDCASSYAGLRSIAIDGDRLLINGRPTFQRLILDQGYYPDGVMTAPNDTAMSADIQAGMTAGFNGARLHQKVFEERFLYHADRLGYLVWGEFGDWGCADCGPAHDHQKPGATYVTQWLEALERDYSHPSIVGWCPLNETHQPVSDGITVLDDVTRAMVLSTKAADRTRPVIDASGYAHRVRESDIYDSHDYIVEADFETGLAAFIERHAHMANGVVFINAQSDGGEMSIPYRGQPYFVSEFGGFRWVRGQTEQAETWGYGSDPATMEEFYRRFDAVCSALLDNPHMFGYCYTQLTDIHPEANGILTFDRKPKFDFARLRAIQQREAAYERRL